MVTRKLKKVCLGLIALLLILPVTVIAQHRSDKHSKKQDKKEQIRNKKGLLPSNGRAEVVVLTGNGDQDIMILDEFYENAPKHFTAPGLPRFALIGKNRKFFMGVGGYAKGTASFDFGNPIDNPMYFTTADIPMHQADGNGGLYQMSAGTSNIFFNFIALPGTKHKLGAYINFNFANPDYGFDLQNAYLTYAGFTIGYKFSMMFDGLVAPPTIDQEGPSSMASVSQTVANYVYKYKDWQFAIGVEDPQVSMTTDAHTALVNQRIPNIPAYIQYGWDEGNSTIRFSAILRNMQYRDLVGNKNHNKAGWGLQLTGLSPLNSFITVYYQAMYGKGISNIMQDMNGLGLDLVPDPENQGRLKAVESWGAYGGFQLNFTKNVFSSHTYSQVRNYAPHNPKLSDSWNNKYKYAQYMAHNVFWQATPTIQVGVEYLWGRLAVMSGERKNDHRIQTMVQFSF
ncbi:MAG: hypothetical protein RR212_00965 [Bacteroidales bacterium]